MTPKDIRSEIGGKVWKIHVQPGSQIQADETLMTLECMKMEIPVPSPVAGTVSQILVAEDDLVEEEQILARIEVP